MSMWMTQQFRLEMLLGSIGFSWTGASRGPPPTVLRFREWCRRGVGRRDGYWTKQSISGCVMWLSRRDRTTDRPTKGWVGGRVCGPSAPARARHGVLILGPGLDGPLSHRTNIVTDCWRTVKSPPPPSGNVSLANSPPSLLHWSI